MAHSMALRSEMRYGGESSESKMTSKGMPKEEADAILSKQSRKKAGTKKFNMFAQKGK